MADLRDVLRRESQRCVAGVQCRGDDARLEDGKFENPHHLALVVGCRAGRGSDRRHPTVQCPASGGNQARIHQYPAADGDWGPVHAIRALSDPPGQDQRPSLRIFELQQRNHGFTQGSKKWFLFKAMCCFCLTLATQVMLSHHNIIAQCHQLKQIQAKGAYRILAVMPLFHSESDQSILYPNVAGWCEC